MQINQNDFLQLLLRHMARSKAVYSRAKMFGMTEEDFLSSSIAGLRLYAKFAEIIFNVDSSPIDQDVFGVLLKKKIEDNELIGASVEQTARLYSFLYDGSLNEEIILNNLPDFIKSRRQEKAYVEFAGDIDTLKDRLNQIAVELNVQSSENQCEVISPFERIVRKSIVDRIPIGLEEIDAAVGGIGFGEFAIVLGYSGGGKSALMCHTAKHAAQLGYKPLILSLEEPAVDICNRFYASVFEIDYTKLHHGKALLELEDAFAYMNEMEKKQLENILVDDVRALAPASVIDLIGRLEYLASGKDRDPFIPNIVFVDQMDYLSAIDRSLTGWEMYSKVAFEFDMEFSQYKIQDTYPFAAWLNHQVGGKLKPTFTRQEIQGFKAIDKPADLVMGIGKSDPKDEWVNIFSLKSRHSKNFEVKYKTDLSHMKFLDRLSFRETDKQDVKSGELTGPIKNIMS